MEQGTSLCLVQSLDQTLYLPHPEPANVKQQKQRDDYENSEDATKW